jgi:peptidoglycan/xylan/chitin deacetylase (PgdA/CDA1 family)
VNWNSVSSMAAATTLETWVPILAYHRVVTSLPSHDPFGNCISVESFRAQLRWLAQHGYCSVPLSSLAKQSGTSGPEGYLPRRPIVITFDDGYEDVYSNAFPILVELGFNATVFLVSDAIGSDNAFDAAFVPDRVPMLKPTQIATLAAAGVSFGSHSCSHPPSLVGLSDELLTMELERSRCVIADLVGYEIEHFAYPRSKVDKRVEAAVATAGYKLGCAGVGTRFEPLFLTRIDAARAGEGPGIEMAIRQRRLKWRLASLLGPLLRGKQTTRSCGENDG